jgi:hypothetical protein
MMKTLSEQVELLEVNNRNTIYQMKKWREHAESLELRLDNLIEERDETLVNRDIAEDLVDELRLKRKGLQMEVDNLAEENGHFANFLEGLDYSPCEIDNIAGGWTVSKDKVEMSDIDKAIAYYKDRGIEAHENDGAVYYTFEDGLQLELSANEISYRAELYNEQLKMTEEK